MRSLAYMVVTGPLSNRTTGDTPARYRPLGHNAEVSWGAGPSTGTSLVDTPLGYDGEDDDGHRGTDGTEN